MVTPATRFGIDSKYNIKNRYSIASNTLLKFDFQT